MDWLTLLDNNSPTILTIIGTLSGALIGGWVNGYWMIKKYNLEKEDTFKKEQIILCEDFILTAKKLMARQDRYQTNKAILQYYSNIDTHQAQHALTNYIDSRTLFYETNNDLALLLTKIQLTCISDVYDKAYEFNKLIYATAKSINNTATSKIKKDTKIIQSMSSGIEINYDLTLFNEKTAEFIKFTKEAIK